MSATLAYRHAGIPQPVDVWVERTWWPAQVLATRETSGSPEVFVRVYRRPDHYYYRWISTERTRGTVGNVPVSLRACSLVSAAGASGQTLN